MTEANDVDNQVSPQDFAPDEGTSGSEVTRPALSPRSRRLVLGALCTLLAAVCWFESRSLASLQDNVAMSTRGLAQMRIDAQRIAALSVAPKRAVDHRRSSGELLADIASALRYANVPMDRWQDSVPQPPHALPQGGLTRLSTRLYLEDVSLAGLTKFAHRLLAKDPSLSISSIRITAPRGAESADWRADLGISYLVLDPTHALSQDP